MAYRPRGGIAARKNNSWGKPSTSQRIAGVSALDRNRAGTHSRMERGDWSAYRAMLIQERGERCQRCGVATSQLILNHKVAHARGGSNLKHNLELLCHNCDNNQIGSANRRGSRLLHGGR